MRVMDEMFSVFEVPPFHLTDLADQALPALNVLLIILISDF